jgi:hypothetical protein
MRRGLDKAAGDPNRGGVSQRMALTERPVTIDLNTSGVEVYGRKKRGVAYNRQG